MEFVEITNPEEITAVPEVRNSIASHGARHTRYLRYKDSHLLTRVRGLRLYEIHSYVVSARSCCSLEVITHM